MIFKHGKETNKVFSNLVSKRQLGHVCASNRFGRTWDFKVRKCVYPDFSIPRGRSLFFPVRSSRRPATDENSTLSEAPLLFRVSSLLSLPSNYRKLRVSLNTVKEAVWLSHFALKW